MISNDFIWWPNNYFLLKLSLNPKYGFSIYRKPYVIWFCIFWVKFGIGIKSR